MFLPPTDSKTWVEGADDSWFPIQNLPLGLGRLPGGTPSLIIRIGDFALNVRKLMEASLIPLRQEYSGDSCGDLSVEDFRELRRSCFSLLDTSCETLRDRADIHEFLIPLTQVTLITPCRIPNFTDFYSGIHHASNVGRMFRPDMPPLLPNYRHLPIAYNGRASSIRISETPVIRPKGQMKTTESELPIFDATRELDFEVELGFYVARHDGPNQEIPVNRAEEHILGVCLVNDWSARDIQRWEYQPLGPFLAKSFMTSVSPWIVSLDVLEPFRIAGQDQDPEPPIHLRRAGKSHFDIQIEGQLSTSKMSQPQVVCITNAKFLYWSFAQQLSHLTSNGLECCPGELCASGTISGDTSEALGSLLEMTWRGTKPIQLSETGEERTFLQDGDQFTMHAFCEGGGYRIGLGHVSGSILKAT